MFAAWWHPLALAVIAAIAAAVAAIEICTMYFATGLHAPRAVAAAVAAALVIRWAVKPADQQWVDLAIGALLAVALIRQLWAHSGGASAPSPPLAPSPRPRGEGWGEGSRQREQTAPPAFPTNPRFMSWGLALVAAIYTGGLLGFGVMLRQLPSGFAWVLLALVVTWACDTAAYLVGRAVGKRPFMQQISPRKTVEGAVAGLVAGVVAAVAFVPFLPMTWWQAPLLGVAWSIAAQSGDLVESMMKRDAGVKDSGTLIPGHGGMLDRIDSLLFVAPAVFAAAITLSLQGRG